MQGESVEDAVTLGAPLVRSCLRNLQSVTKLSHKKRCVHTRGAARSGCQEGPSPWLCFGPEQRPRSCGGSCEVSSPRLLVHPVGQSLLFHAEGSSGGQGVLDFGVEKADRLCDSQLQHNCGSSVSWVKFFTRKGCATNRRQVSGRTIKHRAPEPEPTMREASGRLLALGSGEVEPCKARKRRLHHGVEGLEGLLVAGWRCAAHAMHDAAIPSASAQKAKPHLSIPNR